MTLSFHALWMLCALGPVVFGAAVGRRASDRLAIGAGFAAAATYARADRLPDPVWVAALVATAAGIYLFRPRYAVVAALLGGAAAGFWTGLLEVQGLSWLVAAFVASATLAISARLATYRPRFAPETLRDEGLLIVALVSLAVAVLPGIQDGWHAAGNLTMAAERPPQTAIPLWTLALLFVSTLLGALYSLWSRR